MANITKLDIYRKSEIRWIYNVNENPTEQEYNAYTGSRNGDILTINSINGAIILPQVPFSVVSYYDEVNPDNNLPAASSADELFGFLQAQGFFANGGNGGGSGGVSTFKQLLDVDVATFIGRSGQIVVVNEDATKLILVDNPSSELRFQDLLNFIPDNFPPNQYFLTSSQVDNEGNAIGVVLSSINNIVNRPPAFDEYVITKGWQQIDSEVVPNEEDYSLEVGDLVDKWFQYPPDESYPNGYMSYMVKGRWNGGDMSDANNFENGTFYTYELNPL